MAGVSMKAIKTRIKSMQSTRQITKAMELVAASKLRSAQNRAIAARPYSEALYAAMGEIAASGLDLDSPYLRPRPAGKPLYVVIAGDRGLAGGYNSNILKLAWARMEGTDCVVLPIGRKAAEFFTHRGCDILTDSFREASALTIGGCYTIARLLSRGFLNGQFSEAYLGYTHFASLLSQTPALLPLLPLSGIRAGGGRRGSLLYEGGPESVFNAIVPEYLGGTIFGALCESTASEQAARRMAMDAATKNADDMISDLSLRYNQARQGAITQEITEIVAGAEE